MTDILERLRMQPKPHETIAVFVFLCREAAVEIERLRGLIPTDAQSSEVTDASAQLVAALNDIEISAYNAAKFRIGKAIALLVAHPPAAPVVPPEVLERRRKGLSDYERPPLGQPPSWLQEQEKTQPTATPSDSIAKEAAERWINEPLVNWTIHRRPHNGCSAGNAVALCEAMHDAFMAMCSHRDSPDDEVFQDAIDALGLACGVADALTLAQPQAVVNQAPSEFDIAVMKERDALRAVALEFIAKVDQGAARSISTYAAFKAALALSRPEHSQGE